MEQIKEFSPYIKMGAGTIMSSAGAYTEGRDAETIAKMQAAEMRVRAKQALAVGSREAAAQDRETALAISRAQAVAAASGGGAVDPTVLKIIGDIAARGSENVQMELYNAGEEARGLRNQAAMTAYEGKQARKAGTIRAATTLMSGVGKIADKWGGTWEEEKAKNAEIGYTYGSSKTPSPFM